MVKRTKANETA